MIAALVWILLVLTAGSLVYCGMVIVAARRYLAKRPPPLTRPAPVSIVKPLHGAEEGLADHLRSFLSQDYPADFEVIFGVDEPDDAALPVVEAVRREFPRVASRVLVTGTPPYPNPKVYSLQQLVAAARYDLVVMSDSDIRVTPDFLRVIAAEFQDERLGLVTCPYRGVAGAGFWTRLEVVGMNTEFIPGVLVARLVEGMKFAVGPTIVARKKVIDAMGGLQRVKDYYIDDFLLGKYAAENGFGVELSSYVIEHHIGAQTFARNARHRVTWLRGTRRSRPSGYIGQVFTYPLPLVLLLLVLAPSWWPLAVAAFAARMASAWAVGVGVLDDPLTKSRWWLVPAQDLVSFVFYLLAFCGNTISWRGRRYLLLPGGRFRLLGREA